jgi:Flp pilus assembly protein TadD
MEYHPPAMAHVSKEDAEIYGGIVTGMYRFHDMLLGRLLDLVGPETTVILLSDHGFYSDHLRPFVKEHSRDPAKKISPERSPTSWHRPHGVFIAAGESIKRDELIHGATLLDVAPTILALLGLPVADDMDGKVLTRIFKEPVEEERIDSYEPPHPNDGVHRDVTLEETDPWAARQALVQLAELGYITLPPDGDVTKMVKDAEWDRRSNLAQIYFTTGRQAEAIRLLRELLAEDERPHLRCRIALALLSSGKPKEAEEVMDTVKPEEAASPLPRLIRGQILLAQDRLDEGIAVLEPLQNDAFPLSHLHTVLGQAYLRRGLLDQAEAAFRKALQREEENAEAHDGLGIVLRRKGKYEDSVYEHMRSAALLHHRPLTHIHLGMALIRTNQIDWAIRAFEIAAELSPTLPFPHRILVHLYRRTKNDRAKADEHFACLQRLRKDRANQTGSAPPASRKW